jgi:hypothetical protein
MAASAPAHPGRSPVAPGATSPDLADQPVPGVARAALVALGAAALWAALTVGLALVSERQSGMLGDHAWGFVIGIMSYVFMFIGFVVGLVYLVTKHGDAR